MTEFILVLTTVPELVALPVVAGSTAYLDWIKSETKEASKIR
jgi:uncharacterized protein involved in tolerance to divalent cations